MVEVTKLTKFNQSIQRLKYSIRLLIVAFQYKYTCYLIQIVSRVIYAVENLQI